MTIALPIAYLQPLQSAKSIIFCNFANATDCKNTLFSHTTQIIAIKYD